MALGLGLVIASWALSIASSLLTSIPQAENPLAPWTGAPLRSIADILRIVGAILCLNSPEKARTKPLLYALIVVELCALTELPDAAGGQNATRILTLASVVLFALICFRLSAFQNRPDLVRAARQVLTLSIACALAGAATYVVPRSVAIAMVAVVVPLVLFVCAKYYLLVRHLQWSILKQL